MRTSFSDGVITIRPFEPEDVPSFFAAIRASAQVLGRWMPWCHADYSMDEAKAWLATCQAAWSQGASYPFLIIGPESHEVMGSVDINQINRDHNFGNIGYWVASAYSGKGIATAAVKLVTQFGFTEASFARLEIVTQVENIASRRVAEKVGAKLECIARNRLVGWGKSHDAAVYSLIPADAAELDR
jgi:RimJ/RimL family protein N-acetyltransferase